MQGSFENILSSYKDGIIGIVHVNDIEGDVLCAGFCGIPNETGKVMTPTGLVLLSSKP
jgi:hypothetical protein